MAQSGYTPILIYASGTTGNTPSASNLTSSTSGAELALNYYDGKLFYKDASGNVQVLAGKGGTGVVAGSNTQIQYNNNGAFGASANLTFDGTTLTANTLSVSTSTTTPIVQSSGSLLLKTNGTTTAVTIDTSQNVGIGTTSPAYKFQVSNTGGYGQIAIQGNSANGGIINFYDSTSTVTSRILGFGSTAGSPDSSALRFDTNGAERARIDSSGYLLVGKTATSATTVGTENRPNGTIYSTVADSTSATITYGAYSTGAGAYRFYVDMGGTIHATSIVITAISDQRLKENVKDIDTGLSAINSLKPRRFDWIEGKGQNKKNAAGFIAQEFGEIFPNSLSTSLAGEDGIEYITMNHEELIPSMVKAIQELSAQVTALQAKVGA